MMAYVWTQEEGISEIAPGYEDYFGKVRFTLHRTNHIIKARVDLLSKSYFSHLGGHTD